MRGGIGQQSIRTPPPPPKRGYSPRGDTAWRSDGAGGRGGGDGNRGQGQRYPRGGNRRGDPRGGGALHPPEEKADLTDFTPERAYLLWREVYGNFPHHNYGSYLDGGVADDTIWQRCWRRLAAQSSSWYTTPTGAVGRQFTAMLAVEWQGAIDQSCNS